MTSYTFYALGMNLLYLFGGLVLIQFSFWYMNRSIGMRFGDHVWTEIRKDPKALALYFGLRFAGVCYFAAAFVH